MRKLVTRLSAVLFILYKVGSIICVTKIWKPNVDVENRQNWVGETYSKNCRGLIFPENLGRTCVMGIRQIETQEIVLPRNGDILLREGGSITFSEDNENCIRLKQLENKYWTDPNNWISEEENRAVPDVERIPCDYDDVIFPKGSTFGVYLFAFESYVNSIRMDGKFLSDEEWGDLLLYPSNCEQFYYEKVFTLDRVDKRIKIRPSTCTQESGCVCSTWKHRNLQCHMMQIESQQRAECHKPIRPVGHCRDFCGGVLHLIPEENFDLEEFRKQLPQFDYVDTYSSKVLHDERDIIQVVLAEKEDFSGYSIIYSKTLYSTFKEDLQQWKIKNVVLTVSGDPLNGRAAVRHTILFVIGTLLVVVAGFGLLFYAFTNPSLHNWSFTTRIPFSDRLSTAVTRFAFARFENRGEGELSLAGSVLSLDKEFDNPLYGHSTPSTSTSTVKETFPKEEQRKSQLTETTYKNPVYFVEDANDIEE